MERALNGWTGGQYSVLRAWLGFSAVVYAVDVWIFSPEGTTLQRWGAVGLLSVVAGLLVVGVLDRAAAVALSCLLLLHRFLVGEPQLIAAWPAFESILLLHVFVPSSPYGAWSARGRSHPGGDWRLSDRLHDAAWLVVGMSHLLAGLASVTAEGWSVTATPVAWTVCVIELSFLPLALISRLRPLALALGLASLLAAPMDGSFVLAASAHLMCFTPAWLPPRPAPPVTFFYDGACGLCHRAVRFFIAEDGTGDGFVFAPLHTPAFERLIEEGQRSSLPDSLVLVEEDGGVRVRSDAVLVGLDRLGGGWRIAAWACRCVPSLVRDGVYDLVARHRHRLSSSPVETCPLLPESLRTRFIEETTRVS